jgi:hypothetical protein
MKVFARRQAGYSIGILAVALTLTFGLAPKRMAQTPESPNKFTITDGDRETGIKVTTANGRITKVRATRGRETFDFKHLKAGERPSLAGRPGQSLLCARLKPNDTSRWTFCSYIAGPAGDDAAAKKHFDNDIYIESFSWSVVGGGGGTDPGDGGGGSGGSSNCWEDQELQMSICDP